MATSHKKMTSGVRSTRKSETRLNNRNLNCDTETHEALDILSEWMVEKVPGELKKSVKISKSKVIKFLAREKLQSLGLLEVAKV